ncbi:MAG: ABC transporter permease [Chloroflexi bacterium]|nr:ABC transporter permease [Chloroflexota bacterium]
MATTTSTATRPNQQLRSRSRSISAWTVLRATIVKDLQIQKRYLPDLVGNIVELGIRVLFFFMLSGIISVNGDKSPLGRDLSGHDMFVFFQGALLLFIFNSTALNTPVNTITRDLSNGTMEYLYSNPSSRYAYFLGTVVAKALITMSIFVPLYLLLIFSSSSSPTNMLLVMAVCLCALVTLVAFGVMIGLLGLLWKQVGSVTQVLGILFELLAGAYFPIAAFPEVVQYLAYALPYTWGYDLIRYYSFNGQWQPLLPVWIEWLILIGFGVFYTLVSRILLHKAERVAKRKGLHLM